MASTELFIKKQEDNDQKEEETTPSTIFFSLWGYVAKLIRPYEKYIYIYMYMKAWR